jgi:hypothetical protein
MLILSAIGVGLMGFTTSHADSQNGEKKQKPGILLLGTLEDWKYPGIKMPHGAEMRDGGFQGMQSAELQAVLTTPDDFDKVVAFYEKKFGVTADGKAAAADNDKVDKEKGGAAIRHRPGRLQRPPR